MFLQFPAQPREELNRYVPYKKHVDNEFKNNGDRYPVFSNSSTVSYRYGFNSMEKDDEHTQGKYDFGARIYDSRIGRWMSLDPVVKSQESPYASFSNNPIWFVDPNGEDTLVMHRKLLYEKHGVNVYKVTFSLIVNNVEKVVGGVMYMGANSTTRQLPDNADFKLEVDKKMANKDYGNETIHVDYSYQYKDGTFGNAIFFHPQNFPIGNTGCLTLSSSKPVETPSGNMRFDGTGSAILKVKELYKDVGIVENGDLLNSDGFLLKTESEAKDDIGDFGPLPEPMMAAPVIEISEPEIL
jgi:RHS repeat-associated protein